MDVLVQLLIVCVLLYFVGPWMIETLKDVAVQLVQAFKEVRGEAKR